MKKLFSLLFLSLLLFTNVFSQSSDTPDQMMNKAQSLSDQKEYAKARYLYLQAYNAFFSHQNLVKAIDCGASAATLYYKESLYKEAFDLCRALDENVLAGEKSGGKSLPDLRYKISKVRFQMYIALKRGAQSKQYLDILRAFANASTNDDIHTDFLYTKASFYYTFGAVQEGDASFKLLIDKYKQQKNYSKVSECYKTLIGIGVKSNNAALVSRTYDQYIIWTNSVKSLTAKDELSVMKRKFDASQQTVQEKDHSIKVKTGIMIGLGVVIAILAVALVLGAIAFMRLMLLTKKQKKTIQVANEHNELKTKFIHNISSQMEPTLKSMNGADPAVKALLGFAEHIQELSQIESTMADGFTSIDIDVSSFCQKTIDKVKNNLSKNITITVDAPKMNVNTNPEQLERILLHLLNNAVEYTPDGGKIWFEFKKRGAHTFQFVVTDTGSGIAESLRDNLFKPFSEIRNLADGDGLGLPICSLIAAKMNGSLSLDKTYGRGSKFILELHV